MYSRFQGRGFNKYPSQTNRNRERDYKTIQQQQSQMWPCRHCGFLNKTYNRICGGRGGTLGCKRTKDGASSRQGWTCPCGFNNAFLNPLCGGVGGHLGCGETKPEASSWNCDNCGFRNRNSSSTCESAACTARKPLENWICPSCRFVNRNSNYICGGSGGKLGCKFPRPSNPTSMDAKSILENSLAAAKAEDDRENVKVLPAVYIGSLIPRTTPVVTTFTEVPSTDSPTLLLPYNCRTKQQWSGSSEPGVPTEAVPESSEAAPETTVEAAKPTKAVPESREAAPETTVAAASVFAPWG